MEKELMVNLDKNAAQSFFKDANAMIDRQIAELALRSLLCTYFIKLFPDEPWWITAHAKLAESESSFRIDDATHHGYVDVLIGRTVVEYKNDLTSKTTFDKGYYQVKEYCAGLLNDGANPNEIIGVLSDTVRWFAYDVEIISEIDHKDAYGPDDIRLLEHDKLDMSTITDESLAHFERFINEVFGRFGSLKLTATSLANGLGLNVSGSEAFISSIEGLVKHAMHENPAYAQLIENLWNGFVNSPGREVDDFQKEYAHELYIVTLAKLICANILQEGHIQMELSDVRAILEGKFFENLGIDNFVEYDYFGWLHTGEYIETMSEIACEIQKTLAAFDFRNIDAEDIFGSLLLELASSDKRILLGQAPTPQWLAHDMVAEILEKLGSDKPQLLDMCCGSGVFIVETLKQVLDKLGNPESLNAEECDLIYHAATGMDIDPLAVMLSKANWIIAVRHYIGDFQTGLHVPIYHADSMFATTPVTQDENWDSDDTYVINLDGSRVHMPTLLFEPSNRILCGRLIDLCNTAAENCSKNGSKFTDEMALDIYRQTVQETGTSLSAENDGLIWTSLLNLGQILVELKSSGRNGIWSFLLENSFMPALLKNQFNGIISNPPWLTLSRLSDNPYKEVLRLRASEYGIMPTGSSFLHVELATVFFVGAIDRYLSDRGFAACVLPKSILNGHHEEGFRAQGYLDAPRPVRFSITGIWSIPKETFKNKAAVLIAEKNEITTRTANSGIAGREYSAVNDYSNVEFSLISNGTVSAYSCSGCALPDAFDKVDFTQGFDAFPRTALFFKTEKQGNGSWTLSSIPMQGDSCSYLVSKAKTARDFVIPRTTNIDDRFMFDTVTSNHVLPFADAIPVKVFLPIKADSNGTVSRLSDRDMLSCSRSTRNLIDTVLECGDKGIPVFGSYDKLVEKLDWRRKLTISLGNIDPWVVVYGASGKNLAATTIEQGSFPDPCKFVIDQTLYWHGAQTEEEALFYEGMLNCNALNEMIKELQAEGEFDKRHIHMLPLMFIPEFDVKNDLHAKVVARTRAIKNEVRTKLKTDSDLQRLLDPTHGNLPGRRTRYRKILVELAEYDEYERACELLI